MIGTIARPSKPSVKLTALAEPIITKITKGIKKIPRFIYTSFRKGSYNNFWLSRLRDADQRTNIKANKISKTILFFPLTPSLVLFKIFL